MNLAVWRYAPIPIKSKDVSFSVIFASGAGDDDMFFADFCVAVEIG
jgi:hypothetical protein